MYDPWMKLCEELDNKLDSVKLYQYLLTYIKDNNMYINYINNDDDANMDWLYKNYNLVLSEHYSGFKEYVLDKIK